MAESSLRGGPGFGLGWGLGRLVSLFLFSSPGFAPPCRRVVCALGRPLPRWLSCLRSVFFPPGALPLGFSAFVLARKRLEEVFASRVAGGSEAFSKEFSEIFDLVPRCGLALGTPFSPAWSLPSVAWPYLFFFLNGHADFRGEWDKVVVASRCPGAVWPWAHRFRRPGPCRPWPGHPFSIFFVNGHAALPLSYRFPPDLDTLRRHSLKTSCLADAQGSYGEYGKLGFA